jgi:UDP-glucose 4-epimerase
MYSKVLGRELPHKIAPRRDGDIAYVYASTEKVSILYTIYNIYSILMIAHSL